MSLNHQTDSPRSPSLPAWCQPIFTLSHLTLLFILLPAPVLSQTSFTELFDDPGQNIPPGWSGDLCHFILYPEENYTLLRLNAGMAGRSQIRTASRAAFGSWSFYIRHEGFTPSNLNRLFIFLLSDRVDLDISTGSRVNGYALRTGDNTLPRKIRLVRLDEGVQVPILESEKVVEEGVGYQIEITRSRSGEWRLYLSEGYGTTPHPDAGPVTDNRYWESSVFGFLARYTRSNVRGFFLGNIRVEGEAAEPDETISLLVTPSIFSPDDLPPGGRAAIHYQLDRPGYSVSLLVFDRFGRQVRSLTSGETGGLEGTLFWDGRDEAGSVTRPGIYILYFEAVHGLDGRRFRQKEIVVVAGRW